MSLARRYETANGLAADIRRHLSNEPVVARPPSALYRFQQMVRRNKPAFAAAGAVAAALVLGLSLATVLFLRERAARSRAVAAEQQEARLREQSENALAKAEAAEKKATEEAAIAKAVSDFLSSDLLETAGNDYQVEYLKAPAIPPLQRFYRIKRN